MKTLGYYNGKFDEIEKMSVPMWDRASFFGDGVYDATYSRNYIIHGLDDHIDRFYNSARLLEIKIPHTKEEMKALLNEMVRKMDTDENFVYFQATRGAGPRDHIFPKSGEANIWITICYRKIADVYKKIQLITLEDTRFFHCNIKTLNLIPSVVAAQRAEEAGCKEAVLHRSGRVTECAHSNVHILKDGTFITAPTDNLILPGITRKNLIRTCGKLGIPVQERPFTLEELFSADEVMISSVSCLGLSADHVDGKPVGGKAPELLRSIQDEMLREFLETTEK